MALPPSLRYLPARLKPLGKPLVWCPILAFALLAAFIWEYRNNPAWFESHSSPPLDNPAAEGEGLLTPEQEAEALNLQVLDTLISSANADLNSPDALSLLSQSRTGSETADSSEPSASPFAAYLDQYRFMGGNNPATSGSDSPSLPSPSGSDSSRAESRFAISPVLSPANGSAAVPSGNSALGQALAERLQTRNTSSSVRPVTSENASREGSSEGDEAATSADANVSFSQQGISPAQLPGSSINFLRTTPEMSPPPGTTGYRPPASINLPQFSNTAPPANSFTNLTPASPGALGSGPQPRQPVAPNATLPNTQQTVPQQAVPPSVGTQPSPFSVGRPPGVRPIGGGQINTFSNPLGSSLDQPQSP